jgi:hypothetical protein
MAIADELVFVDEQALDAYRTAGVGLNLLLESLRFAPLRGAKEKPSKHKTDVRRSGQLQALDCGAPEN